MATPPDEIKRLQEELRRLREEVARSDVEEEEIRRLPPEVFSRIPPAPVARPSKPGRPGESLSSYMERRKEYYAGLPDIIATLEEEEENPEEKRRRLGRMIAIGGGAPPRAPGESLGSFIARRRKFYAEQRVALREASVREQMAAAAIPEELLPHIPSGPEPGESREAFLARQRSAVEERERVASSIRAERAAAARSAAQPSLTSEEILASSERSERLRARRAFRLGKSILIQKASAEKLEESVPIAPEIGESRQAFDVRQAEARLQAATAKHEWESAVHSMENTLRYPYAAISGGPSAPAKIAMTERVNKAFAQAVLDIVMDPESHGLTPGGLTQREIAAQRLAAVSGQVPIVNLHATIDSYIASKRGQEALIREATDMLGHQQSQVDQWIAFQFLTSVNRLPPDFTADMIMKVEGDVFEQQAKDYLLRHGGFIGSVDHSNEVNARIVEAGPPPVFGPPLPTDPREIIDEAADMMKSAYGTEESGSGYALDTIVEAYRSGSLDGEQRSVIEQFASVEGIALPSPAAVSAVPEERFGTDSNVQGVIAEIKRLMVMNTAESRTALRALLARLAAETVSEDADTSAKAVYILTSAGLG